MPATYNVQIPTTFPHGLSVDGLANEIRKSAISVALDHISSAGNTLSIVFKAALGSEEALLAVVMGSHRGVRPGPEPSVVRLSGPVEADNKPVVVVSPSTDGLKTWLTSHGDNVQAGPAGRSAGTAIRVEFNGNEPLPATETAEFRFDQPIEVHDGQLNWGPDGVFSHNDKFSLSVVLPPTAATSTPGAGNVNEVALGGGAVMYVPATNGSHTVNLTTAVPVPLPKGTAGYWNCDTTTGVVTSAPNGDGRFALFNFPNEPFLIANVLMGNRFGLFDVDVYKTDWIHHSWTFKLSVTKASAGAGIVSGWLLIFRPSNVRA